MEYVMPDCCASMRDLAEKSSEGPSIGLELTNDLGWCVNGCCGGGCFVLAEVKFCPYCGAKLPEVEA